MDSATTSIGKREHQAILGSLRNLEARLLCMVDAARTQCGREPGVDPFRGLYVSEAGIFYYLNDAQALVPADNVVLPLATGPSFTALQKLYGLLQCELDVLLIAITPEVDPRYERIFAYLQDDVTRKRPCIDLILSL